MLNVFTKASGISHEMDREAKMKMFRCLQTSSATTEKWAWYCELIDAPAHKAQQLGL